MRSLLYLQGGLLMLNMASYLNGLPNEIWSKSGNDD